MKVFVIGGFLGAGKTTLALALARALGARGERVALVTNDQGSGLVDTALARKAGAIVEEIVGGCFCCKYSALEGAIEAVRAGGATVVVAEAVGSCTDLVATVLLPMRERAPDLELMPLAIAVDPFRVEELRAGAMDADVAYLFRKQIEEADVVLMTRADLEVPDVVDELRAIRPSVPLIRVAAAKGVGVEAWLEVPPPDHRRALDLDYDRYAAAEARLGWLNATVRVRWKIPTDPSRFVRAVLAGASELPVAHVKVACVDPPRGAAALVRRRGAITGALVEGQPTTEATFLVNARVALPPAELEARIRESLGAAASGGTLSIDELASFEPARPEPERRVLSEPEVEASCCAAFYDRPDVQYLLGDGLHPGGVDLTFRLAELLELQGGGRLLDVACGRGTSLRAIAGRYPIVGVGLDAGATSSSDGRVSLRRGDAHAIPFEDRSFDAVLCECAVSTFLMQSHATKEMARVLRPGGRLAMSDMVVDGPLPPLLAGWAENGTCLVRARSLATYAGLLRDAGLEVVNELDASSGLLEILDRIKRRLLGAALGAASGVLPAGVSFDLKPALAILREAEAAVSSGTIRYGVLVARAPS